MKMGRLLFAACVALVACDRGNPPGDAPPPGLTPIPLVLDTEQGGIDTPSRLAVTSGAQMDSLWARMTSARFPYGGPRPHADFSREVLAVAATGAGTYMNPRMRFDGYRVRGDTVEVHLLLVSPTDDCPLPDLFGTPVLIGRVPRTAGPVRWVERTVERCG